MRALSVPMSPRFLPLLAAVCGALPVFLAALLRAPLSEVWDWVVASERRLQFDDSSVQQALPAVGSNCTNPRAEPDTAVAADPRRSM